MGLGTRLKNELIQVKGLVDPNETGGIWSIHNKKSEHKIVYVSV